MDNEYKSDDTSNWLDDELRDIIGEELEMEIDDERISMNSVNSLIKNTNHH